LTKIANIKEENLIVHFMATQPGTQNPDEPQKLSMHSIRITADLMLFDGKFNAVQVFDGKIQGRIDATDATFSGKVNFDRMVVGSSVGLDGVTFPEIRMGGAKIGSQLLLNDMTQTVANLTFNMDDIEVEQGISMNNSTFSSVRIVGGVIKDDLTLTNSEVKGVFDLARADIGEALLLIDSKINGQADVSFAKVRKTFLIRNCKLIHLDLTGCHATTIMDHPDTWPNELRLAGFTYEQLGGFGSLYDKVDVVSRPLDWFLDWLNKDIEFSLQPYKQCASVLRKAGMAHKANAILFAAKEKERLQSGFWGGLGRWLLKISIGYGIGARYLWAAFWALLLAVIGLWVAATSPVYNQHSWYWWFAFSVDKLIPFLDLAPDHSISLLHGWQRGYFIFVHQGLGALLASFVIIGITGLTERKSQ
jgi:hypothetical protein